MIILLYSSLDFLTYDFYFKLFLHKIYRKQAINIQIIQAKTKIIT